MEDTLIAQLYPEARRVDVPAGLTAERAFEVTMRPFGGEGDSSALLHHLQNNGAVLVNRGTLSHPPTCLASHGIHPLRNSVAFVEFTLLLLDYGMQHEPVAIALRPKIDRVIYPHHPHLIDRSFMPNYTPQDALCAYFPSDESLTGGGESFAKFFDYIAIFLAKHIIWKNSGLWLGHVGLHDPRERLKELDSWDKCFCGSGRNYSKCHRDEDRVRGRALKQQEAFIRLHQARQKEQKKAGG